MKRTRDSVKVRGTKASFDYEWLRYDNFDLQPWSSTFKGDIVTLLLNDVQLPKSYFHAKTVLDAGCGGGRFSYALAQLGAEVIATDMSSSGVRIAKDNIDRTLGSNANAHLLRSDVMRSTFRPEMFDFILAWGVLHHTLDTKKALASLVKTLKPGGHVYLMLYEKQNPIKEFFNKMIRRFTTRIPPRTLFRLCIIPSIFGRNGFLRRLNILVVMAQSRFENYDWYSCPLQQHHTEAEVLGWFREFNLGEAMFTHPATASRHRVPKLHSKYGGTLHVRARKLGTTSSI